jgi:hypothetical protein
MSIYLKQLIVVLGLSALVFAIGKSTALNFMDEADFKRRRNIWMLLSAAAFLSPNFWLFALVAAPALYWGGKRDSHPLAFYVLLMNVIPDISVEIPTDGLGIKKLFSLSIFRLLSLCVLLPAAWQLRKSKDPDRIKGLQGMDWLLLAYGVLQAVLFVSPDMHSNAVMHTSFTNELREAFLFVIDCYLLYYVASRSSSTQRAILDTLAAFCLACLVMASAAVFESWKHWLLYTDLYGRWAPGIDHITSEYLVRGGLVRAEASSGNALALGYLLAIAFGFWLFLQSHVKSLAAKIAVPVLLWLGLLASSARGPWLGAVLIYFAYAAFRPRGVSRLLTSALIFLVIAGMLLVSPAGTRIRNLLPFLGGKVDQSSITYREQLLDRSWELIQEHPLFGDQDAMSQMQGLRQGQGIIDVVDTYVGVTLFYGFVGLSIFLAFILNALFKAYAGARITPPPDPEWPLLGACLAACIVGTLLMLADCGFFLGYVTSFFLLAGLATAYSRLTRAAHRSVAVGTSAIQS